MHLFLPLLALIVALASPVAAQPETSLPAKEPRASYQKFFAHNAKRIGYIKDLDPLFDSIGSKRFVLLGESTHGTHEFYVWRDKISRHLIVNKGFKFIAVEGSWQEIYRLNAYVKHKAPQGLTARDLLLKHKHWPAWTWANKEFEEFLEWLYDYNATLSEKERIGIYGIDMQDPEDSMQAVLDWFANYDPANLEGAQKIYGAIQAYPDKMNGYMRHLTMGRTRLDEAFTLVAQAVQEWRERTMRTDVDDETAWNAVLNALVVKTAEAHTHARLSSGPEQWNIRAQFMHDAVLSIAGRYGADSKGIIWAHNTHLGDYVTTERATFGEVNLGRLLRLSQGVENVYIVGLSTHHGSVIASSAWEQPMQVMKIRPVRQDSYESILHDSGLRKSLLIFDHQARTTPLTVPLMERAIGVVYTPPDQYYVPTILTWRYDAFLYFDQTKALATLHEPARPAETKPDQRK